MIHFLNHEIAVYRKMRDTNFALPSRRHERALRWLAGTAGGGREGAAAKRCRRSNH